MVECVTPCAPLLATNQPRFPESPLAQGFLRENPRNNTFYILKPHRTITQRTIANPRVVGRVTPCAPLLASNHRSFPQSSPSKFLLNT